MSDDTDRSRVYRLGPGGWAAADDDGTPALSGRAGERAPGTAPALTWVVTGHDDVLATARRRGLSAQGLALLEQALAMSVDRPGHPMRGHVDRSSAGELILSVPTVSYVEKSRDVHTGVLTCVVLPHLVLTAEAGEARVLERTADRLTALARPEAHPEDLADPHAGTHSVLGAALLTLVAAAADVEAELGAAVAETEPMVFSPAAGADPAERIYLLNREVAEARRAIAPLTVALLDLEAIAEDLPEHRPDARTQRVLQRVQSSAERVDRHLEAQDQLLGAMLDAHLSLVSVRQNGDTRKISAWAAITLVPTLLAGIWGMNFDHMPELTWRFGYPLALTAMVGACLVLYRLFRRSGWL